MKRALADLLYCLFWLGALCALAGVMMALSLLAFASWLLSGCLCILQRVPLWALSLRVLCVAVGLVCGSLALLAEYRFLEAARPLNPDAVVRVSLAWPYERQIREAAAHMAMLYEAPPSFAIAMIERARAFNPHSADLNLALMKYSILAGDEPGALRAYGELRRLLPKPVLVKAVMGSVSVTGPQLPNETERTEP